MNLLGIKAAITLDTQDYERGLGNAEKRAGMFSEVLKANLVTKGVEVAIKGLTRLATVAASVVGDVVSSYADYEQLAGGVETLFKDSADKVKAYAAEAYQTAGMSANEYMETVTGFSASLIQSLGGDTGQAAELANMAITDMSDNANKMGTDMASVQSAYQGFAKQNYTMLDNLKLGYGGTKSEMDRLIKDAARLDKSFKANTKTVTKNGKAVQELDYNYADVVKAIHVVQTNMGITGTTAREAAQTISGSVNMLKSAWKNLLTGIGSGNQSEITRLVGDVVKSAETAMRNVIPVVKTALTGIGQVVRDLAPVIGRELPGLVEDLLPAAGEALSGFMEGLFAGLPGLMSKGLPMVIRGVSDTLNGIVKELPKLGARVYTYLKDDLMPDIAWAIAEATGGGWEEANSIYHGMTGFLDGFISSFEKVATALKTVYDTYIGPFLSDFGGWLADTIIPKLGELWQAAGEAFDNIAKALSSFMESDAGVWLTETFVGLWEGIKREIELLLDFLTSVFRGDWESAWQTLVEAVSLQFEGLLDFFTGLFRGDWESAWQALADAVKVPFEGMEDWIYNALVKPFTDYINWLLQYWESAINRIVAGLNVIPGVKIGSVSLGRMESYSSRGGAGRKTKYFANGGILGEGESAWVGEYAPERLRVVNGRAIVTPVSNAAGRFVPQGQNEKPTYVVFEIDGVQRTIYKLNKAEEQRVGLRLTP